MAILASSVITENDGDINYEISSDTFNQQEIIIECQGLPSTWEIAGTLYRLENIAPEGSEFWVITESALIRPFTYQKITWQSDANYKLLARFVRYIKEFQIFIHDIGIGGSTPPQPPGEPKLLDPYPGVSVFALEQVLSDFEGPFYETANGIVTKFYGNIHSATGEFVKLISENTAIEGTDQGGKFTVDNPVTLSPNRFVNLVMTHTTPQLSPKFRLRIDGTNVLVIDVNHNLKVYARRLDGTVAGGQVARLGSANNYKLISFLVENGLLKTYINGSLQSEASAENLLTHNGTMELWVRRSRIKFVATWNDIHIPENPGQVMQEIMQFYSINP